jgi:Cu/Ag efflux pump CusA
MLHRPPIGTGGFIETPNQRLAFGPCCPSSVPRICCDHDGKRNGKPLRLDEVARVVEGHQPLAGDAVINGGPDSYLSSRSPHGKHAARPVGRGGDYARWPGLPDMEIDATIFRPATFVELSIRNLTNSLFIGCLLLVVVLVLFLFDWRIALISCIAIPLSLIAALLVLQWRGTTINTMILAGFVIALGDIVDDAIIDTRMSSAGCGCIGARVAASRRSRHPARLA